MPRRIAGNSWLETTYAHIIQVNCFTAPDTSGAEESTRFVLMQTFSFLLLKTHPYIAGMAIDNLMNEVLVMQVGVLNLRGL